MFNLINKIQKKSKRTRRSIAFGVSFGVTSVIFILWVIPKVGMVETQFSQDNIQTQAASPISSLKDSVERVFSRAKEDYQSATVSTTTETEQDLPRSKEITDQEVTVFPTTATSTATTTATSSVQ